MFDEFKGVRAVTAFDGNGSWNTMNLFDFLDSDGNTVCK